MVECEIGLRAAGTPGLGWDDHRAGSCVRQGAHVKQGLHCFTGLDGREIGGTRREHRLARGFDHLAGELTA